VVKAWVFGVIVLLTSVAASAQTSRAADAETIRARQRIALIEGMLERAVQNGVDNFSRQIQALAPNADGMAMLMGDRRVGPGTLGLRAMVSLDPTMGKSGYPLLMQTGESADGVTPLVDRQHPHDFFMELAASYSVDVGADGAAYAYFGLPGEPALGPTAFMHRFSGMRNPEAPLTHHWLDSTHITFGVATLGASKGPVKLEASWFNGRHMLFAWMSLVWVGCTDLYVRLVSMGVIKDLNTWS